MNTSLNGAIRRLTNVFIVLLLAVSGVAAYTQIANRAFYNGPQLAAGKFDPRQCPPYDQPVRGTIYDRNGQWLARSVPDNNAPCGYRREYYDPTLSPLIGYYSYRYGTAGVEDSYNDILSGVGKGESFDSATSKLLHRPRYGSDIYLTIDDRIQKLAEQYYDASALHSIGQPNAPCEHTTNPNGSIIVEDPNTGAILAMVSHPYFDANKITDDAYWQQINSDPNQPLINRATQGLYDPGSSFKTVTLAAAIDSGKYALDTPFSYDEATDVVVNGQHFRWDDYFANVWGKLPFPMTLEQGYAYSDNTIYARAATTLGADGWLSYVRKFGIATPGVTVDKVPFDAPSAQSQAYSAITDGKPTDFSPNLLAASGFGQGELLMTPLTMAEISSTMAAGGALWVPHVGWKQVPHGAQVQDVTPNNPTLYGGVNVVRPETAQAVRHAMWSVMNYGTGYAGLDRNGIPPKQTGAYMGGKTGTGQLESGDPNAWWISLAPDDQQPGAPGGAKLTVTVSKEHGNEGACQVYVANDIYQSIASHNYLPAQ